MSSCWSFHLALLGPSGAHWLDDPPDVTSKESTRQHAVDDALTTVRRIISVLEADGPTRGS